MNEGNNKGAAVAGLAAAALFATGPLAALTWYCAKNNNNNSPDDTNENSDNSPNRQDQTTRPNPR